MSEQRTERDVTTVEWRVESETLEDEFGADEAAARHWLAKVQERVAAGDASWEPAVLMRRTVTVRSTSWEPVSDARSDDE